MAGDEFPELAEAAVLAGATGIEMGIPYSDPLADGPSVQRAGQRALEAGITPPRALEFLRRPRAARPGRPAHPDDLPAIVERYGIEGFCTDAAAAGATGLIIPDMPPDEAQDVGAAARAAGLDLVQLVSPHQPRRPHRAGRTGRAAGSSTSSPRSAPPARATPSTRSASALIARVRTYAGDLPLVCGFGISRGAQVRPCERPEPTA